MCFDQYFRNRSLTKEDGLDTIHIDILNKILNGEYKIGEISDNTVWILSFDSTFSKKYNVYKTGFFNMLRHPPDLFYNEFMLRQVKDSDLYIFIRW